MPRGFNNWRFSDVKAFLQDNDFKLSHVEGSHYFYAGVVSGQARQVTVHFHDGKTIHPKTMKSVMRQSGIAKEMWLNKQK